VKRTVVSTFALLAVLLAAGTPPSAVAQRAGAAAPVAIPFELAMRRVIVQVTINKSRPLAFILDTGASLAIVRLDVAKELGLKLEGQVHVSGAGPGSQSGSQVRGATWSLVGHPDFSQPIAFALPMPELSAAMGQPIDGIIGGEFIRQFVVELDYQARHLRLHRPEGFSYSGPGEAIPIEFVNGSQPTIPATVTPKGHAAAARRFLFDIGAGQALALHSPFVREQKLLESGLKTVRSIGGAGAGGKTTGQIGRVQSLQIGSFTVSEPITMFSEDQAGSFANSELAGNVGAQIAMRFRLFFDYGRKRIILEPTSGLRDPFDRAFSGVAFRGSGADFRTLTVAEILEDSPASQAGLQAGDVLVAVNDVPTGKLRLTDIYEMFEKPVKYSLTIRRGGSTLTIALTPARLI
jgi:hypothetical protein